MLLSLADRKKRKQRETRGSSSGSGSGSGVKRVRDKGRTARFAT